jgi:hypothetical protein
MPLYRVKVRTEAAFLEVLVPTESGFLALEETIARFGILRSEVRNVSAEREG